MNSKLLLIMALYQATLHGGERVVATLGQSKDFDVKTQASGFSKKDARDIQSFWNLNKRYYRFPAKCARKASLKAMHYIIRKNNRVLGSIANHIEIGLDASPLMSVAWMSTKESGLNTSEDNLFDYVLSIDTDNERRVTALVKVGIECLSLPIVSKLLSAGTDVTKSPHILTAVTSRCSEIEKAKKVLTSENSDQLLEITVLLLSAKADLSGVAQMHSRPHLKVDTCYRCKLIYDCIDDEREELEKEGEPGETLLES